VNLRVARLTSLTRSKRDGEKMMTSTELKKLRKRFGLTQAKLAEMIGYSQRAIECWEYDRGRIPERVARLLKLTFEKAETNH